MNAAKQTEVTHKECSAIKGWAIERGLKAHVEGKHAPYRLDAESTRVTHNGVAYDFALGGKLLVLDWCGESIEEMGTAVAEATLRERDFENICICRCVPCPEVDEE